MEDFLCVGTITNTHGIKGEVKVFPHTDDVNRFSELECVYIDTGKEMKKVEIQGVRYFKNLAILKFKGINDINDVERYKGKDLMITRDQAIPLEEGEYFICDIIGAKVVSDEGEEMGTLTDVLQTGANDVYVVTNKSGKELLFPVIPDCVLDIDTENKLVKVHVMPGLLD